GRSWLSGTACEPTAMSLSATPPSSGSWRVASVTIATPTQRPRGSSFGRFWRKPGREVAEGHPALSQHLPAVAGVDAGDVEDRRRQAGQRAAVDRQVGGPDDLRGDLLEGARCRLAAEVRRSLEDRAHRPLQGPGD